MDKKTVAIFVAILLLIAMLVFGALWISIRVVSLEQSTNNIAVKLNSLQLPTAINGKNGYTPIKGVDYNDGLDGNNGKNGVDSLSTYTKDVFYVDVPVNGKDGIDGPQGATGSSSEIRMNPQTKDLESKSSNDIFWQILIPCSQLLINCPTTGSDS